MLNHKQVLSTQRPQVGQVWVSSHKNYYRVDAVDSEYATVTRVAYEFEGQVSRGRPEPSDTYYWHIDTLPKNKEFRVVATNLTRFESWLNRVTK